MKHLFIGLMLRYPIITQLLVMAIVSYFVFFSLSYVHYQNLDFKWFFTLTGITVALLAQIYLKLQDTKFIANATVSEINRISDSVNIRSRAVVKLIFFHLMFGILNFLVFSVTLPEWYKKLAIAVALSFVVLWLVGLLFGYLLYQEMADLNSELLRRKLQHESRQIKLKGLT